VQRGRRGQRDVSRSVHSEAQACVTPEGAARFRISRRRFSLTFVDCDESPGVEDRRGQRIGQAWP